MEAKTKSSGNTRRKKQTEKKNDAFLSLKEELKISQNRCARQESQIKKLENLVDTYKRSVSLFSIVLVVDGIWYMYSYY